MLKRPWAVFGPEGHDRRVLLGWFATQEDAWVFISGEVEAFEDDWGSPEGYEDNYSVEFVGP